MKIEILGLDNTHAYCKVQDDGIEVTFRCSGESAGHEVLRRLIRQAMDTVARQRADDMMAELAAAASGAASRWGKP